VARFKITGTAKGDDKCTISNSSGDTDCRLDASTSSGAIRFYIWTYSFGGSSSVTDGKTDSVGDLEVSTGCDFFKERSTSDDNGEKYLNMTVGLVLEDREGTRSSQASRTIRVYPAGNCGY
jgi:hypothetical protein